MAASKSGKRRSRGEGGLHWDESRQRWIATVTIGYDGRGKRMVKRASGRTKTAAKKRLRAALRDLEDGTLISDDGATVADALADFLRYGLARISVVTQNNYETIARMHIGPTLGSYWLRDLRASHVDRWLADLSGNLSARSLRLAHGLLNRTIKRAMARDLVKRNVVELVEVLEGREGRQSKSLDVQQAGAILTSCEEHWLYPYIVVSLLTGIRTEELRALTWERTHLQPDPVADVAVPPHLEVWRSVRRRGETKTKRSRRTIALPDRCVEVLHHQRGEVDRMRTGSAADWEEHDLVFPSRAGTIMDPPNVRREFRAALEMVPGIEPSEWTPRELRHSFVSLPSDQGVPVEEIARLVGHSSPSVTEMVYRHQIRPVMERGANTMNRVFGKAESDWK